MVDAREWRWAIAASAAALLLASLPYLVGWGLQTDELRFGGFVYAVEDGYSYLAKMRQGAEGAWLFHIAYTPEPHPGALFFPFHLLLGKLAARLPGADLTARLVCTYHAARLLLGAVLLLTAYRFLAAFTAQLAVRRLAFLLLACGGGLGWLLVALGQPGWLGSLPLDFILPEGFTFLVLYAFPHIALARALLLWSILFLLRAWSIGARPASPSASLRWAALAGIAWLLMGLIVPFYVPVAWAVAGAMWLALSARKWQPAWREAGAAALAALFSAPIVAYSVWIFTTDPVYAAWSAQNRILSPHPLHYLAAFGVPLTLTVATAHRVWRADGPGWAALAWIAVVPLLVYLPFNLQRRLVEGVQVPLSLLAAQAVLSVAATAPAVRRAAALAALLALSLPTNALLVGGNCLTLLPRPAPVFRDANELTALDWLSGQTRPDDVVLAAYETGNYLPARVGARAFVGHGPESVRVDEKRMLVARFFDATTSDDWRQDLLATYGVDWLLWGPAERAVGDFDPRTALYLQPAYQNDTLTILRVIE